MTTLEHKAMLSFKAFMTKPENSIYKDVSILNQWLEIHRGYLKSAGLL